MTKPSEDLIEAVGDALADCHNDLVVRGRKTREPTLNELAAAAYPIIRKAVLAEVAGWLRMQADVGAEYGIASEKGTTRRAAYGGGSLALTRAADRIKKGDL